MDWETCSLATDRERHRGAGCWEGGGGGGCGGEVYTGSEGTGMTGLTGKGVVRWTGM